MVDRRDIASPPDDAGHTGSSTTPDQMMVHHEVIPSGPAPQLMGDRQKAIDRSRVGPVPVIIAATILLLLLILLVFMPR